MNSESNPCEWLRLAESDLSVAHHLLESHRPKPLEIICFHTQQASEKMLKYFLVVQNLDVPKVHDLNALWKICLAVNEGFDDIYEQTISLNRYSVIPRYPNELLIEEYDAIQALEHADIVMQFVKNLLSE